MRSLVFPPTLACALACAAEDTTAPELDDARFEDPSTVVLRFSEPLAPVTGVDPNPHFRLGVALVIDDLQGGELTVYYDLAHHFPDGIPGTSRGQGPAGDRRGWQSARRHRRVVGQ